MMPKSVVELLASKVGLVVIGMLIFGWLSLIA